MANVAEIITSDSEKKIVVLSAVSGTTNKLVGICTSLYAGNVAEGKQKIKLELFKNVLGSKI